MASFNVTGFTESGVVGFQDAGAFYRIAQGITGLTGSLNIIPSGSETWALSGIGSVSFANLPLGFTITPGSVSTFIQLTANNGAGGTALYNVSGTFGTFTQPTTGLSGLTLTPANIHNALSPISASITNAVGCEVDVTKGAHSIGGTYTISFSVNSISPNIGLKSGNTPITISGTNFSGTPAVTINGIPCTNIVLVNSSTITCKTPASATLGAKTVTVTILGTPDNTKTFTYVSAIVSSVFPPQAGTLGGDYVAVEGSGFTSGTVTNVLFGGVPATQVSVLNDTVIDCRTPAHAIGSVNVTVVINGTDVSVSATPIFSFLQFSWQLQNLRTPVHIGDKVKVESTNGGLDHIKEVHLDYIEDGIPKTIVLGIDSYYIIYWSFDIFWFYLPLELETFEGPVTITFILNGDPGTQFSGSVVVGVLQVLFENASGIYSLDVDQIHDTLYFRAGYITIPNQIMLPDMRFNEEEIYEEDFFSQLPYPYKILAQDDYNEDLVPNDFSIISSSQPATTPIDVEIPSPFVRTAFLP